MVFWIGAMAIALAVAAATGWRLLRRTADPAWPAAAGFALALAGALGAAVQATVASLQAPALPDASVSAPPGHGAGGPAVAGAQGEAQGFENLVARLEASLKEDPSDAGRWALLGRSYIALGRTADAAKAFEEAVARTDPPDPGLIGEYGETLVAAAQGRIPPDAEAAFARVLTLQPDDARARYYMAMARAEKGDVAGARADLETLLRTAPEGAPWRATVFEALQDLGGNPEIPADVAPKPAGGAPAAPAADAPRGPSPADVAAAQDMSPEDRREMIRGMVDGLAARLEANPDDFQGWIRLANSYMVLREPAKASDALRQALKLQPGNVGILLQVAEIEIGAADGQVTPAAEAMLRRALDRQPGNPQALWRLGQAAAARGETEAARRMWTELLPKLMEADPLKDEVRKALQAL